MSENFGENTSRKNYGVYIHVPYCASKCAYCSFVSDTDFSDMDEYIAAVTREIDSRASEKSVDTIFIGGGTPSVLKRGQIGELISAVKAAFSVQPNVEITVECNPDSGSPEFFQECVRSGVNRISMGLQSSCDRLLEKVGRRHDFGDFLSTLECARREGIDNISADIMLGLPDQSVEDVRRTALELVSLEIPHISAYGLSVEEGTPLYKSGFIPDEDLCAEMYEACADMLMKGGYRRYEVSNFALRGRECRHNLKYWTDFPYLGFGVSAHSYEGNFRSANTQSRAEYISGKTLKERIKLDERDKIEERIMLSLRTDEGIDLSAFRRDFGFDLLERKRDEARRLILQGMIKTDGNRLRLTDSAYYMMNSVILALL